MRCPKFSNLANKPQTLHPKKAFRSIYWLLYQNQPLAVSFLYEKKTSKFGYFWPEFDIFLGSRGWMGQQDIRIHTGLIHLEKNPGKCHGFEQNPEFSQIWGNLRWIHLWDGIDRSINFLTSLVVGVAGRERNTWFWAEMGQFWQKWGSIMQNGLLMCK